MNAWDAYVTDATALDADGFAAKRGKAFLVSWNATGSPGPVLSDTQPIGEDGAGNDDAMRESMRATVEEVSVSAKQIAIYPLSSKSGKREITIGRAADSDVYLDDATVSQHHAAFSFESSGGVFLTDKSSQNGTKLDGLDLEPNRPYDVPTGRTVQFGSARLTFMSAWQFREFVRAASTFVKK